MKKIGIIVLLLMSALYSIAFITKVSVHSAPPLECQIDPTLCDNPDSPRVPTYDFVDLLNNYGDFEYDGNNDGLADGWLKTSGVNETDLVSGLIVPIVSFSRNQSFSLYPQTTSEQGIYKTLYNIGEYNDIYFYQVVARTVGNGCSDSVEIIVIFEDVDGTYFDTVSLGVNITDEVTRITNRVTIRSDSIRFKVLVEDSTGFATNCDIHIDGVKLYNLTEIFGSGNEPTNDQMSVMVSYLSSISTMTNKIHESIGDFEEDNDNNGMSAGWNTTNHVTGTYLSQETENVNSGYYSQRLTFQGGITSHEGLYIDLNNIGDSGDTYYLSYDYRSRTNYCNLMSEQRVRKYMTNSYINGDTLYSTPNSTAMRNHSVIFTSNVSSYRLALTMYDSTGLASGCQVYFDSVYLVNLSDVFGEVPLPEDQVINSFFKKLPYEELRSKHCDHKYTNTNFFYTSIQNKRVDIYVPYDDEFFVEVLSTIGTIDNNGYVDFNYQAVPDFSTNIYIQTVNKSYVTWRGLYTPSGTGVVGDIQLNNHYLDVSSSIGLDRTLQTIVHELGHAIGLKHAPYFSIMMLEDSPELENDFHESDYICIADLYKEEE